QERNRIRPAAAAGRDRPRPPGFPGAAGSLRRPTCIALSATTDQEFEMHRTLKKFGLAAGAALMLTATTVVVAERDEQGRQGLRDRQGPEAAGPLAPAGEGRRVFLRENCYGCHGGRA